MMRWQRIEAAKLQALALMELCAQLTAVLEAVLPYAESRLEDIVESAGTMPSVAEAELVETAQAAVDGARAILAELN